MAFTWRLHSKNISPHIQSITTESFFRFLNTLKKFDCVLISQIEVFILSRHSRLFFSLYLAHMIVQQLRSDSELKKKIKCTINFLKGYSRGVNPLLTLTMHFFCSSLKKFAVFLWSFDKMHFLIWSIFIILS